MPRSFVAPTRTGSTTTGTPGTVWNPLWTVSLFTTFMIAVPWPTLWLRAHGSPMEDRRVYASQLVNGFLSFDVNTFDSALSYVTGEYVWGWVLDLLVRTFELPVDVAFGIISTFIVLTGSLVVARHARAIYATLLCNPIFVDLAFSQMRIGLAIALASWAHLLQRNSVPASILRILLLAVACIVHTSAIIFIGLFLLCHWFANGSLRQRPWWSYAAVGALGVSASILLGPARGSILGQLGDRRALAEYTVSSLKFYLIWVALLSTLTLDWRAAKPSAIRYYSVAALISALLGAFIGVYSNRVLAVSLPMLIASLAGLSARWRPYIVLASLGNAVIYWFYWLHLIG